MGRKCIAVGDSSYTDSNGDQQTCDNSDIQNWSGNVLAGADNALTLGQGVDLPAKLLGKGDNFTACCADSCPWAYRGGAAGSTAFALAFSAGAAGTSTRLGDAAYNSRIFGADSCFFGNQSLGTQARVGGGLLNPASRGAWRLGRGVNGVPVFRLKAAGEYLDLLVTSGF